MIDYSGDSLPQLCKKIDELRYSMEQVFLSEGALSPRALLISQELDKSICKYIKIVRSMRG